MPSLSDLRQSPNSVLFELALRVEGELHGASAAEITDALTDGGFLVTGYPAAIRAARTAYGDERATQVEEAGDADEATHALTAEAVASTLTLRVVKRRAELLQSGGTFLDDKDKPLDAAELAAHGRRLAMALDRYELPPGGAALKDVLAATRDLRRVLATIPDGVPGLDAKLEQRVAAHVVRLHGGVLADEDAETTRHAATGRALDARARLERLLLGYLAMREAVDEDRRDAGLPALPNDNVELLRQWDATRPGAMAARKALDTVVVVPADDDAEAGL